MDNSQTDLDNAAPSNEEVAPLDYSKGVYRPAETWFSVAELIDALRPFAEDASLYGAHVQDELVPTIYCEEHGEKSPAAFTVGDLRRALVFRDKFDLAVRLEALERGDSAA